MGPQRLNIEYLLQGTKVTVTPSRLITHQAGPLARLYFLNNIRAVNYYWLWLSASTADLARYRTPTESTWGWRVGAGVMRTGEKSKKARAQTAALTSKSAFQNHSAGLKRQGTGWMSGVGEAGIRSPHRRSNRCSSLTAGRITGISFHWSIFFPPLSIAFAPRRYKAFLIAF